MKTLVLEEFIEKKSDSYQEPERKGTPRGEPIGFSKAKYVASLWMMTNSTLKEVAKKTGVSYGLVRKWHIQERFLDTIKRHCDEFADLFLEYVKKRYKQRGFDTQRLRVDLNYKLSFPFLSLILTLLGIPFAFLMGKRGVLWGIGLSLAIAIIYWGCTGIFKNLGYTNNLNAYWAGWGPHLLFGFVGLYLIAKMRT